MNKIKLKEITSKIGSGATPRGGKNSYKSEGISLIRSMNVYDSAFEYTGLAFIDERQAKELSNVQVEQNDILLNITGASVARCCMVPNKLLPGRVNQHVAIIRIRQELANSRYILYCLISHQYKQKLLAIAQGGATREALTKDKIEDFEILVPSLSNQHKIASILSAYDDLIENNNRRIKILEEMAQVIYAEWFVNFRFPGHEKLKMVKSELGMIPEGWVVKKLGDVIELAYGRALKKDDRKDGVILVYGSGGVCGYHDEVLVNGPGIIVGRKGNVGSVFWSEKDFYPIDTVFYVKSSVQLHYVYFNLLEQNFINTDAAVPGLNRNQAYKNSFLLPAQGVRDKFVPIVESIFKETELIKNKIDNLCQTRDLLLPKLISGEIDVEGIEIKISEEVN